MIEREKFDQWIFDSGIQTGMRDRGLMFEAWQAALSAAPTPSEQEMTPDAYASLWRAGKIQCKPTPLEPVNDGRRYYGPEFSDGCDHEGFQGGCERQGHTVESCPTPPEVEPVYQIDAKNGYWKDINAAQYSAWNKDGLRKLYTSPPFPNADEVTRRDELLFENAQLRGQLLKYEDPDKYMALGSVLSGTITKEQCEEWLKTRGSPKAEYDAEGSPLNLMAAAADLLKLFLNTPRIITREEQKLIPILRKFIKDPS